MLFVILQCNDLFLNIWLIPHFRVSPSTVTNDLFGSHLLSGRPFPASLTFTLWNHFPAAVFPNLFYECLKRTQIFLHRSNVECLKT